MSNELEKRLREIQHLPHWEALQAAARIGAEIEREECAALIETADPPAAEDSWRWHFKRLIRARGGK